MNKKTLRLVMTGLLLAVGTVLSMISMFHMPYGGTITLFSMVPVMLLSYKYGIKWGVCTGAIFGVLQAVVGTFQSGAFAGVTGLSLVAMVLLDYLVAFAFLGTAGMFRNKIKNHTLAFTTGAVLAGLLRLMAHFVSGFILWGSYAENFFSEKVGGTFGQAVVEGFSGKGLALLYSIIYNASYMIPEIIITVIGIVAIMAIKPLKNQILTNK